MKGKRAAIRYAKSLVDLVAEQGSIEKVYADMLLVYKTCSGNRELSSLLNSPIVKADKKQSILKEIFHGQVSEVTENFISLITLKRREALLEFIAKAFIEQYKLRKKIHTAVVTTAWAIDEDLRTQILELVKKNTNDSLPNSRAEVELIEKTNDKLLGGFILQIGDKRIYASIAKQVRKLAMSFSENPYIKEY